MSAKRAEHAKCKHCGQTIEFEIVNTGRVTQRIRCPVCKKFTWVLLKSTEKCLFRLIEYEEKLDAWEKKLNALEKKLNEIGGNDSGRGKE